VKDLINEVSADPKSAQDILADKVKPATDKLKRRFRSICQIHGLKIAGAAVATIGGARTALFAPGAAVALGTLLGAGGVGLIAREVGDTVKAYSDLKDMPFYLLWRLQRAKKE